MNPIGFSTGAIAKGDFRKALEILAPTSGDAVELSALRAGEFTPLMDALPSIDFRKYQHVSLHTPKSFGGKVTAFNAITSIIQAPKVLSCVVAHLSAIVSTTVWGTLGSLLALENTDEPPSLLRQQSSALLRAGICIDIGHAVRQDITGATAVALFDLARVCPIKEIHLSVCRFDGKHVLLSSLKQVPEIYRTIVAMIPDRIPIILEGEVPPSERIPIIREEEELLPRRIERELSLVRELLGDR